jgi:hypothetical protein
MRAHRVRFTPPKKPRTVKRRFGEETFLHSPAGYVAKFERKVDQYREQDGTCRCGHLLELATAQFEHPVFREGEENWLICRDCQKASKTAMDQA